MISISFELPRQLHAQPQELPKGQEEGIDFFRVLGMKGGGVSISSMYSSTNLLLLTSSSFSLSLIFCSFCSLPSVSFLPSCSFFL